MKREARESLLKEKRGEVELLRTPIPLTLAPGAASVAEEEPEASTSISPKPVAPDAVPPPAKTPEVFPAPMIRDVKPPLRMLVERTVNNTVSGQLIEVVQVALSLASCSFYIASTYVGEKRGFRVADFAFSFAFVFHYALHFFIAERKLPFVFSVAGLVDLVTIPSGLVAFFIGRNISFLLVLRLLKILRLAKVARFFFPKLSAMFRQLLVFVFTLLSLVFITAGLVVVVEGGEFSRFHDACYFVVVTMTTVGFGDLAPRTALGRGVVVGFMILAIIIIPIQTDRVIRILATRDPFRIFFRSSTNESHVIVTGAVSVRSLAQFLEQFYHPDRVVRTDYKTVVLANRDFSESGWNDLIRNPSFDYRVILIRGSPLVDEDLERADVDKARACFVLSPQNPPNVDYADKEVILTCMSIKRFRRSVDVITQVIKAENKHRLESAVEHVICLNELKSAFTLRTLFTPGFSALLSNFFITRSFYPKHQKGMAPWLQEYAYGVGQELYAYPVPEGLSGVPFTEAVVELHREFGILLFGLTIPIDGRHAIVCANPGQAHVIEGKEIALLLAQDEVVVQRLHHYVSPRNRVRAATSQPLLGRQRGPSFELRNVPRAATPAETASLSRTVSTPQFDRAASGVFQPINDVRLSGITGHTLVCGPLTKEVAEICRRLLENPPEGSSPAPVVLLVDADADAIMGRVLRRLTRWMGSMLHIVLGDSTTWSDLVRAGINNCDRVLILPNPEIDTETKGGEVSSVSDADSVISWYSIEDNVAHMPHCVIELNRLENIKFLRPKRMPASFVRANGPLCIPSFASGRVLSRELFNSLAVQSFFCPYILPMVKRLLLGPQVQLLPVTAHGGSLESSDYGQLIERLLASDLLPLGLYRSAEARGALEPYVFVNPPASTPLANEDMVYVVSRTEESTIVQGCIANAVSRMSIDVHLRSV